MSDRVQSLFAAAERAHAAGQQAEALRAITQVLEIEPGNARALNTVASQALRTGDPARARDLLLRAVEASPEIPAIWLNLAAAHRASGDHAEERTALDKALALDPYLLPALLQKAQLLERQGGAKEAAKVYGALLAASPPTPGMPAALLKALEHARAVVDAESAALGAHIESLLHDIDSDRSARFIDALDVLLGRKRVFIQQPTGLHIPYLPAIQFYDRRSFLWVAELETAASAIREELAALLDDDGGGFRPYVTYEPGTPLNQWADLNHSTKWSAFFLWKDGERVDANCARCPRTVAALARIPRMEAPGRAPSVFFSLLAPGTRIPPHTGVTNARLIVHLPLIVPAGCGFRVGWETRAWREGEALIFDDTIEHEAWNDSAEPRAVLIFDIWNPHLDDGERRLIQAAMRGIDGYYGAASPLGEGG